MAGEGGAPRQGKRSRKPLRQYSPSSSEHQESEEAVAHDSPYHCLGRERPESEEVVARDNRFYCSGFFYASQGQAATALHCLPDNIKVMFHVA